MSNIHSAKDVFLAYEYQSMHALMLLLSNPDDEAKVRIEVEDDITLQDPHSKILAQIKHTKHSLGLRSDDLWKTLRIWCDYVRNDNTSGIRFYYITTSQIQNTSELLCLTNEKQDKTKLDNLKTALDDEAKYVLNTRDQNEHNDRKSYEKRYRGCEAYLSLNEKQKCFLLSKIRFFAGSPNIFEYKNEISKMLTLTPPDVKRRTSELIIEWWNNKVYDSLKNEQSNITKNEMLRQITSITNSLLEDILTDDMQYLVRPSQTTLPPKIQKQLSLINAGKTRITRTEKAFWLASRQRALWVESNPGNFTKISDYDRELISEWEDEFGIACETPMNCEEDKQKIGVKILDWSHNDAYNRVRRIENNIKNINYIRGSYHILSESLKVGWHPNFKELMD